VIRRYYFDGPLVDLAEGLIGPNIKGAATQLSFKMRGNTQRVPWHQDNGYGQLDPPNSITTLTALEDSDEENGCLWIVPGSHREGLLATYAHGEGDRDIDVRPDVSRAIPVPLRAGEALMIHSLMLHSSQGNRSPHRDRRLLFMRYADADAIEVYRAGRPRLGKLLRGVTRFPEVAAYESDLH
jgi:ectoine hydroxylase-related dioxygenase (phytanoyl-CoA dioxygenase family)